MSKSKATKREKIILTIRANNDSDIDALNQLKKIYGVKPYTTAIFIAAREVPVLQRRVGQLEKQIANLEKIKRTNEEVLNMQAHAQQLLDAWKKSFLKAGRHPEPELEM